jgi:hypothetical protein
MAGLTAAGLTAAGLTTMAGLTAAALTAAALTAAAVTRPTRGPRPLLDPSSSLDLLSPIRSGRCGWSGGHSGPGVNPNAGDTHLANRKALTSRQLVEFWKDFVVAHRVGLVAGGGDVARD